MIKLRLPKSVLTFLLALGAFHTLFSQDSTKRVREFTWNLPDSTLEKDLLKIPLPKDAYFTPNEITKALSQVKNENNQVLAFKIIKSTPSTTKSDTWLEQAHIDETNTNTSTEATRFLETETFIQVSNSQKFNFKTQLSNQDKSKITQTFLLDLRHSPSNRLRVNWTNKEDILSRAEIESSTDLINWTSINKKQSLSQINQNNFKTFSNTLNIPFQKTFLRVKLFNHKSNLSIQSFESLKQVQEAKSLHQIQKTMIQTGKSDTVLFTNLGKAQIEFIKLNLNLGQWVKFKLLYSNTQESHWKTFSSGTLYNIKKNNVSLIQNSIDFSNSSRHNFWKLIIESQSETHLPEISYHWTPDTLLVATQNSREISLSIYNFKQKLKSKSWPNLPVQATLLNTTPTFTPKELEGPRQTQSRPPEHLIYWLLLGAFLFVLIFVTIATWKEFKKQNHKA